MDGAGLSEKTWTADAQEEQITHTRVYLLMGVVRIAHAQYKSVSTSRFDSAAVRFIIYINTCTYIGGV